MKFRTQIFTKKSEVSFNHDAKLLLLGSCFTENIGEKLGNSGFNINLNPFGIVYNPVSVAQSLTEIIECRKYSIENLVHGRGLWHSFNHHGEFSAVDENHCIENINQQIIKAHHDIFNIDYLLITLGTSHVFRLSNEGSVVANCHKFPSSHFTEEYLGIEAIVSAMKLAISKLNSINQKVKIVFSVSPVRYLKDGFEANNLSKATILLAINELERNFDNVSYFPAYEIMMDDLRDYRFYAEDMLHPSSLAVDYIWEKFKSSYFTEETLKLISEIDAIKKMLGHTLLNPNSIESQQFIETRNKKLFDFKSKYPNIEV